jgi:hypothetical protein
MFPCFQAGGYPRLPAVLPLGSHLPHPPHPSPPSAPHLHICPAPTCPSTPWPWQRCSHHGQLSLQLLHAVVFEVQLGPQCRCVVCGVLGLASQLPLLPLQQVLLLGQDFDCVLALLRERERERAVGSLQGRRLLLVQGPLRPGPLVGGRSKEALAYSQALCGKALGSNPVCATN